MTHSHVLIPEDTARCLFCGRVILRAREAVLVPDGRGRAQWWHMPCRDIVMPLILREMATAAEDAHEDEATA
jgi:hypothetical protein